MTTPQPAALPEPFAWAWHNKVTGAKGVYFEDPQPFGVTSHPDYEWTHLYNEAQVLAALQSQPAAAGVSDELILKTLRPDVWMHVEGHHREQMLADARAILALRPQSDTLCFELSSMLGCPPSDTDVVACVSSLLTPRPQAVPMTDEPEWIVNDLGELGVRVGSRFFFLYKGDNIEYGTDGISDSRDGVALHDDGTPMHYRIVGKREFGETCWPLQWVVRGHSERRYTEPLTFIPGLSWGKPEDGEWKPLPAHGITAQGAQGEQA